MGAQAAPSAQAATGDLTYRDCFTADSDISDPTNNCTFAADVGPGGENTGFEYLQEVTTSPDGSSLYAVSLGSAAIVRFDRTADGALAYRDCFSANSGVGAANGCGSPATTNTGGTSVYASSQFDAAIVRVDRLTDGSLVYRGCLTGDSDVGIVNDCGASTTKTAGGVGTGFDDLRGLTVSPDGRSVYAISSRDLAMLSFDRATDGALTLDGCFSAHTAVVGVNGWVGAEDQSGTGTGDTGFFGPRDVTVSSDGESVYAITHTDSSILRWSRAADGTLTYRDCFTADSGIPGGTNSCDYAVNSRDDAHDTGFHRLSSVAVSPDGDSVYATGENDASMLRFDRPAGGALTYRDCFSADAGLEAALPNNCDLSLTLVDSTVTGNRAGSGGGIHLCHGGRGDDGFTGCESGRA